VSPHIPLPKFGVRHITVGAALFCAGLAQLLYARSPQEQQSSQGQQQSSQQQQQSSEQNPQQPPQSSDPSAPKPKKVWTNDEVITLRSPADTYLAEKEAQAAADAKEAAKKAELAKQIKEAALSMTLPTTPEETERLIRVKENRIRGFQDWLDRLKSDLPDAPAERKAAMQEQIEQSTSDLQRAQLELKVLKVHLETLPKTPPSEPPSSVPAPPPAPPSPDNPQ
jgi:hypothetical protein